MAVARHIQVATAEDGLVAVQRDVIVDPKRGIAAEREKVVLAVNVGGGKVAVMEQEKVKAVAVPNSRLATTLAIEGLPQPAPRRRPRRKGERCCSLYVFMIIGFLLIAVITVVLIIATSVGGTLPCDPLKRIGEIIITAGIFALTTTAFCTMCLVYAREAAEKDSSPKATGLCLIGCSAACIALLVYTGLAIGGSVLIAENYDVVEDGTYEDDDGELVSCKNSEMPFVLTVIFWALWLLLCGCGCLSMYNLKLWNDEEDSD